MTSLTFLVIISYGDFKESLNNDWLQTNPDVHVIRTDLPTARFVSDINEAFEFSGYQDGLERIKHKLRNSNDFKAKDSVTIIFLNDTAFNSHYTPLTNFLVETIFSLSINSGLTRLIGLETPCNKTIQEVSKTQNFLSTWIFAIQCPIDKLNNISFYDSPNSFADFILIYRSKLPFKYKKLIEDWLMPTSLIKGWYKSIPGISPSQNELNRKYFTIYLEHLMPLRFRLAGFDVESVSQNLNFINKIRLIYLRLVDRVYVNLLKITFRCNYYFKQFLKSK